MKEVFECSFCRKRSEKPVFSVGEIPAGYVLACAGCAHIVGERGGNLIGMQTDEFTGEVLRDFPNRQKKTIFCRHLDQSVSLRCQFPRRPPCSALCAFCRDNYP